MKTNSIEKIISEFDPTDTKPELHGGHPITVCLPAGYQEKYKNLQRVSGRKFARKVREVIMVAIDLAAEKVS